MYYGNYTTESLMETTFDSTALTGLFLGTMIFSGIIGLIAIISYWKIFTKAGKAGWASLVPFYNYIIMLQIAKLSMIYLLLLFIPLGNIYAIFKINIEIAKKFGKSSGFGIGMTLLPIIFIPILAFSDDKYEESVVNEINATNNTFDAQSIINNNFAVQQDDFNNTSQMSHNIPIETNNVPIENGDASSSIIQSTEIQGAENNNDMPSIPVYNEVKGNNMENYSINEQSFNSGIETVVSNDVPVMENSVNQNANEIPNAFNTKPVMSQDVHVDSMANSFNGISNNVPNESHLVQPQEIPFGESQNIDGISNTATSLKNCKCCGSEMPSIVSICPRCGVENE